MMSWQILQKPLTDTIKLMQFKFYNITRDKFYTIRVVYELWITNEPHLGLNLGGYNSTG